jgi:aryl-alcohol dehydrogenase-like predicted oxidoreductase
MGTWAMGSSWGAVDDWDSMAALNKAVDQGVNFFDTADAYGSEPLLGQLRRQRKETIYLATKIGMGMNPDPRGYNRKNIQYSVENCLKNLGIETIDLLQLHCPPHRSL